MDGAPGEREGGRGREREGGEGRGGSPGMLKSRVGKPNWHLNNCRGRVLGQTHLQATRQAAQLVNK